LHTCQYWLNDQSTLLKEYKDLLQTNLQLSKCTATCSMGSCFATEIRQRLILEGYNYLLGEQGKQLWIRDERWGSPLQHSSVAWERVYSTHTFLHIVEYTFGTRSFDRLHTCEFNYRERKHIPVVTDLLRSKIFYSDREAAEKDVLDHNHASRVVLEQADLLILTLGLTEVWWSDRGFFLSQYPHVYTLDGVSFVVSDYQENLDNLNQAYAILKEHNPKLKILVTVSPVHLDATFRTDVDIFTASCASKSILRTVADTFVSSHEDAYYFPSYEIATMIAPRLQIPIWRSFSSTFFRSLDLRHISPEVIDLIMSIFNGMYLGRGGS